MNRGIFITGTDTEVGKTQVTSGLAAALQRKWNASPEAAEDSLRRTAVRLWKPVQSGASTGSTETDSYRLRMGSGLPLDERDIATHTFTEPLAPWLAAMEAGAAIDFAALAAEGSRRLGEPGFWLVEGAGGFLVPLTESKLVADLAAELGLPLLIVARPGLGTVNHTLLTVMEAHRRGLDVLGVVLNGCDDVNARYVLDNAMMIERFGRVPVLGRLPRFAQECTTEADWREWSGKWAELVERHVLLEALVQPFRNS